MNGLSEAGLERLAQVFDRQIADGLHPGAQLVVARRGQIVFERAGGWADVRRRAPVTLDTPFLVYSATKPFTAVCVHQLAERGQLDLDAPVARYWPEFGCRGKETATLRHALLHQAGVPRRGFYRQAFLWPDWERTMQSVARLDAEYPPGSSTAYHVVNYGFILGEVVRRVAGCPIQEYLRREFLEPLGMRNSYPGLPDNQRRRAASVYCGDWQQIGAAFIFNVPRYRRWFLPAASLNTTARDLATFYQMLLDGGQHGERRYLKPETIAEATALRWEGRDANSGMNMRWAMGFHLGGLSAFPDRDIRAMGRKSAARTFGHSGQGGSAFAWADPEADLVFAFVNNRLLGAVEAHLRFEVLANAVWDAVI